LDKSLLQHLRDGLRPYMNCAPEGILLETEM
jgi:hypothetical protein